jgi:hypothetical protein
MAGGSLPCIFFIPTGLRTQCRIWQNCSVSATLPSMSGRPLFLSRRPSRTPAAPASRQVLPPTAARDLAVAMSSCKLLAFLLLVLIHILYPSSVLATFFYVILKILHHEIFRFISAQTKSVLFI